MSTPQNELVEVPDYTGDKTSVHPPRFNMSDVRVLLGFAIIAVYLIVFGTRVVECQNVCKDARDWNEVFEPFQSSVLTALGAVFGYFFARSHND
jgi:hypothetical protein